MKHLIPAILCIVLAAPSISRAEHRPLDLLADTAVSYFTPMKGTVLSAEGDDIACDLGTAEGLKPGMRLLVLRGGEAFVHPITGERIGQAENPVGMAEAMTVNETDSTLKIISGEAGAGDILRVSSAPVRLLFFQSKDVEWGLAEEYFNRLEDTDRFDLFETAPGEPVDGAVLAEARRLDAEAALILTSSGSAVKPVLKQRILWVDGSNQLMTSEVLMSEETIHEARLGEEYFTPKPNKTTLKVVLPRTAVLMTTGDLDGNGEQELVFSSGSTIRAYSYGASLTPALKGVELETSMFRTHLWLEAYDLNADGRDELVITSTNGDNAHSYVYRYNGDEFELLWEDNVFARVVDGKLYAQSSANGGGFTGEVFPVNWLYEDKNAGPLHLPKGIDIYDFQYMTLSDGTTVLASFDALRKLSISLPDETVVWRSTDEFGWPVKTFGQREVTELNETKKWSAGDRMLSVGPDIFVIKRVAASPSAPGFGNTSSKIVAIYPTREGAEERVIVDDLPGDTTDIAVMDSKLLVLVRSSSINPLKLIKGRGIFDTTVYIYPLERG